MTAIEGASRLGYRELGRIDRDPPGHTGIWMTKHLDSLDSGKV